MSTENLRGKRDEIFDIFDKWIVGNEGRETTDKSFGLDYGLEMLDKWLATHDNTVRAEQRERDAQIAATTTSAPLHTPWGQHVAHQIRTATS